MKHLVTIFALAAFLSVAAFNRSQAIIPGESEEFLNLGGSSVNVAFFVPYDYNSGKSYPLVIGMHPAQTPGMAMRQMLMDAANQIGAVLACPDSPDGDGSHVMPLVAYCKDELNIDDERVFITGYSAGGRPTFEIGLPNHDTFRGLIGIAPAVSSWGLDVSSASKAPSAIIVGTSDHLYSTCIDVKEALENAGGSVLLIEKQGVGHTGEYFWTPPFTSDWLDCYNFCMDFVPKPGRVELVSPVNGAEDLEDPVTLEWNAITGADEYEVKVFMDGDEVESSVLEELAFELDELQPGSEYEWYVTASNESGAGEASETWSFTTKHIYPYESPEAIYPEDGAEEVAFPIVFSWSEIDLAESYDFELFEEGSDEPIIYETGITDVETGQVHFQVDELNPGTSYSWRVRGANDEGEGPWSDKFEFAVAPEAPTEAPAEVYPEAGAVNVPLDVRLKWTPVEGADFYGISILDKYGVEIIKYEGIDNFDGTHYYFQLSDLQENSKYSWTVWGYNAGGEGPSNGPNDFYTVDLSGVIDPTRSSFGSEVFPNPATETAEIRFDNPFSGEATIALLDNLGKVVMKIHKYRAAGEQRVKLNLGELPQGVYYYYLTIDGATEIGEVIIRR